MSDSTPRAARGAGPRLRPHEEGPPLSPPADGEGYSVERPPPPAAPSLFPLLPATGEDPAAAAAEKLRRQSQQFTLSGLLLLVTLVSVLLGPIVWLPLPMFAGLVGLGSLVLLTLISVFNTHQAIVRLAWWLLVALYVAAATAAYIHS